MKSITNTIKFSHRSVLKQMFNKRWFNVQVALIIEKIYNCKFIQKYLKHLRNEKRVLQKYDRMSGKYIEFYNNAMTDTENEFVVFDNEYKLLPKKEVIRAREDYVNSLIREYSSRNCIEIGAGELTFITPIAAKNNNIEFSALELSWSRLAVGLEFAKKYNVCFNHLAVGSAMNLPFSDNSFDIVITHHCLEQIRGHLKHIISELYRISKKAVIILEPSSDLGNWYLRQQLRMNQRVRGIKKTIKDLGYKLVAYNWLPYSIGYNNRTGMYIIEKETKGPFPGHIPYVCPICKRPLQLHDSLLFCEECGMIYPFIKNIPCLREDDGILASNFLEFSLEKV